MPHEAPSPCLDMCASRRRAVTLHISHACAAEGQQPIALCASGLYKRDSLNEYSNQCLWCHTPVPLETSHMCIHNGASLPQYSQECLSYHTTMHPEG